MSFFITVLGSSSATPTDCRFPSAQTLHYENNIYLIDCGEGTQMQMQRFNIKSGRINHIFISHLHGDHYLGLMGLLSTFHLNSRKNDVHIYSAPELENIIEIQKQAAQTKFSYKIFFHSLTETNNNQIFEDEKMSVSVVKLEHRIPTYGFIFKEKLKERKVRKEAIEEYGLTINDIVNIKKGMPFFNINGEEISNDILCHAVHIPKSYAYISDTAYTEKILPFIKNTDLLYHEATFCEELKKQAAEKFHSTAIDAAIIAKKAQVKTLLIGHFSARYKDPAPLLSEARSVFENTYAVEDGKTYNV